MKRTAAVMLALLTLAAPAQALIVSKNVGPLIKDAQSLAQAKHYKAALAKLDQAEAVKATPDDETVINQVRQYIARASLDPADFPCTINDGRGGVTRCDGRSLAGVQP